MNVFYDENKNDRFIGLFFKLFVKIRSCYQETRQK